MFFNKFVSMNETIRSNKAQVVERELIFQQINDWAAYKFIVSEPTTISGFAMVFSGKPQSGLSLDFKAGISTSLGPNGLFPYVKSEELMNSNVGIAKTIGFVSETATFTIDNNSTIGFGFTAATFVNLSSNFTLNAFENYWVGVRCEAATGIGTFLDLCNHSVSDNIMAQQHALSRFQRLASATGTTIGQDIILAIPYFYSGSGATIYYPKYPAFTDSITRSYQGNQSGAEFGFKFEMNDLPIQDWEVSSITYDFLDTNVIDSQYCMRVYDGSNFDNLVGTGITLSGYDVGNTLFGNPASFEFIFDPPLKLRTNKTYFAGVAWTHPTTQPTTGGALTVALYHINDIQSKQSSVFAYRNVVGSGALTEMKNMKMPLNFYIKNTTPVLRSIGN